MSMTGLNYCFGVKCQVWHPCCAYFSDDVLSVNLISGLF